MGSGSSERTSRRVVGLTLIAVLLQIALSLAWTSPLGFRVTVALAQRAVGGSIGEASVFEDLRAYFHYADATVAGAVPYRDFLVEYPDGALPLFVVPRLVAPTFEGFRWAFAAEMALFLASDLAGYITGTLIDVSGGKLATQIPRLAWEAAAAEGVVALD